MSEMGAASSRLPTDIGDLPGDPNEPLPRTESNFSNSTRWAQEDAQEMQRVDEDLPPYDSPPRRGSSVAQLAVSAELPRVIQVAEAPGFDESTATPPSFERHFVVSGFGNDEPVVAAPAPAPANFPPVVTFPVVAAPVPTPAPVPVVLPPLRGSSQDRVLPPVQQQNDNQPPRPNAPAPAPYDNPPPRPNAPAPTSHENSIRAPPVVPAPSPSPAPQLTQPLLSSQSQSNLPRPQATQPPPPSEAVSLAAAARPRSQLSTLVQGVVPSTKSAVSKMGKWFGVADDSNLAKWHGHNQPAAPEAQPVAVEGDGFTRMVPVSSMVFTALKNKTASMRRQGGSNPAAAASQSRQLSPAAAPQGRGAPGASRAMPAGAAGPVDNDWFGGNAGGFVVQRELPQQQQQQQQQQRRGDPTRAVPVGSAPPMNAASAAEARRVQASVPMRTPLGPTQQARALNGARPANGGGKNGGGGGGGGGKDGYQTDLRRQLNAIYEHRPYFTYFVSFVQIAVMIISVAVFSLAPITFGTSTSSSTVTGPDGSVVTATYTQQGNFWIGVSPNSLVLLAAKFTPCMRKDDRVQTEILNPQLAIEAQSGCCMDASPSGGNCFTTAASSCTSQFKQFLPGLPCSGPQCCSDYDDPTKTSLSWPNCVRVDSSNATHRKSCGCTILARPCCLGLVGKCELQTKEYCDFKQGTWHDSKTLCSQVDCAGEICGLIPFATNKKPDQWYRVYLALFLHAGFIHLFFVLLFQYSVTIDIEKLAGCVRMACIFFLSGIGGYVVSATLTPYQVSTGSTPACYGVLACLLVELFQSWQLLHSPCFELFKLLLLLAFAFALGLLPYIDNWGNVGGFVFGALSALVFLPYITFGRWDAARKRVLLVIGVLGVIFLMILWNVLLYTNQFNSCTWCAAFDCVDIVSGFCQDNSQDELYRSV